jgi:hypothetical protein
MTAEDELGPDGLGFHPPGRSLRPRSKNSDSARATTAEIAV